MRSVVNFKRLDTPRVHFFEGLCRESGLNLLPIDLSLGTFRPSGWEPAAGATKVRLARAEDVSAARKAVLTGLMRKMLVTFTAILKARQAWTDTREPRVHNGC